MRLMLVGLGLAVASAAALVWWQERPRKCPADTEYTAPLVNAETNEIVATFCIGPRDAGGATRFVNYVIGVP